MTILLGAYGGIALAIGADAACSARARAVGAAAGGLALGVPTLLNVHEVGHVVGAVLVAGAGAMVGAGLAPLARWETFKGFFGAMSRTHPVGMALVAVGVARMDASCGEGIGAEAVKRAVSSETDANLVLFDPESILSNLEVVPYASGIGSVMAIVSVVWLVRRGPRGTWCAGAGLWFVIAWAGLGLLAFSVLGKVWRVYDAAVPRLRCWAGRSSRMC
ncbi:MAG: hypothetical protein KF705_06905 [Phycisphaeraceae bacterium]|nr:hypothetical protein [Phycisphaeraceae bacterium]